MLSSFFIEVAVQSSIPSYEVDVTLEITFQVSVK